MAKNDSLKHPICELCKTKIKVKYKYGSKFVPEYALDSDSNIILVIYKHFALL